MQLGPTVSHHSASVATKSAVQATTEERQPSAAGRNPPAHMSSTCQGEGLMNGKCPKSWSGESIDDEFGVMRPRESRAVRKGLGKSAQIPELLLGPELQRGGSGG